MENWLKFIGVVLILCGIIGSIYIFSNIDWNRYDIAKSIAKELPNNEVAQNRLEMEKAKIFPLIQISIIVLFAGLSSGLIFCALAAIVESLRNIEQKLTNNQDISIFQNKVNT